MVKTAFNTRGNDDKVASVGDLEWPEVQAILTTMGEDKSLTLHKLEIRRKANGSFRTIIRATRKQPVK